MSEDYTDPGHESARAARLTERPLKCNCLSFYHAEDCPLYVPSLVIKPSLPESAYEDPILNLRSTEQVRAERGIESIPVLVLLAVLHRVWRENRVARWCRDYRGNLLVRTAFSQDEPTWKRALITLELVGYIVLLGVFWTAVVLGGRALVGAVLSAAGF